MEFVPVSIEEAEGAILGHNVVDGDGRRRLRKGKPLTVADLELLRRLGRQKVYVARLEAGDVGENEAARRMAEAVAGAGLRASRASTGRVNLYARDLGLLRLCPGRLEAWNRLDGVALATLRAHSVVAKGKMAATLKVIPYGLPEQTVARVEAGIAVDVEEGSATPGETLWLDPIPPRRVGLLLTGSPGARERLVSSFESALGERLSALGSAIEEVGVVEVDSGDGEAALAEAIGRQLGADMELLILAGDTAIQDRFDLTPRALERAGGEVASFGAPVDPGNLLLIGYLGDVPVLGAPGCSRSRKTNIVDLVLPRLLAGDRLGREEVAVLGHGGLLEDVPERPLPRSRLG
ncbi:MAG: molybdopterin-binding protein [Holophagales bacterium]|nr:molybdopterin-binding protein [Holophagales bacterium]